MKLLPHLSDNELRERLKNSRTASELRRWQSLYLIQTQKEITASYLSGILCIPKPTIYLYVQTYNKWGDKGVTVKKKGGRKRFYLSLEEETAMLDGIAGKAVKGEVITAKDIRDEVEKKVGHPVSDDYLWDLFHRHSWNKKKPRPKHPDSNEEDQEAFKKNSRSIWNPPS